MAIVFDYSLPPGVVAYHNSANGQVRIDVEAFSEGDHIARTIRSGNTFYEADLLEYLAASGPVGGVFIDVGANIGNHSVFFGKFLASHVVAVEPSPVLVPILLRNMEVNKVGSFEVVPVGIDEYEATAGRIVLPEGAAGNVGRGRVVLADSACEGSFPVTTLDRIISERRAAWAEWRVSLLKIDVEGMELKVLRGAQRVLEEDRPQLIIELGTLAEQVAVSAFLRHLNYHSVAQFCATPTFHFIDSAFHTLRAAPPVLRKNIDERNAREEAMRIVDLVPAGARLILVHEERWPREWVTDRTVLPFTERNGHYWGPPTDDTHAVAELEDLRTTGVAFIVFTSATFWWLEFYTGFLDHLRSNYSVCVWDDHLVVFDLRRVR